MALRIGTNIPSLMIQRNLVGTHKNITRELKGLSSGARINLSSDDAAGLAISETMRGKLRSTDMALRNANDGVSLIQVAEGGLGEISSLLIRLRELAIQSASDTAWDTDRNFANTECIQLKSEIQKMALSTEFNGIKLLNGSDLSLDFQVGGNHSDLDRLSIKTLDLKSTLSELGILQVNTLSKEASRESIEVIGGALIEVSLKRAMLGAVQNRLEKTMNHLNIKKENLAHAKSRIRDVDVIGSVANLNKHRLISKLTTNLLIKTNNRDRLALNLVNK